LENHDNRRTNNGRSSAVLQPTRRGRVCGREGHPTLASQCDTSHCHRLQRPGPACPGAGAWPVSLTRFVVPFAAGGALDVLARIIADRLSRELGATFVIESRPGAGGAIGAQAVVRAAADGSTLLFTSSSVCTLPALNPNLGFDPLHDLLPVSVVGGPVLANGEVGCIAGFLRFCSDVLVEMNPRMSNLGDAPRALGLSVIIDVRHKNHPEVKALDQHVQLRLQVVEELGLVRITQTCDDHRDVIRKMYLQSHADARNRTLSMIASGSSGPKCVQICARSCRLMTLWYAALMASSEIPESGAWS